MSIQMLGIEHTHADLKVRERFALTTGRVIDGLQYFSELEGVRGVVILSTCNRMEIWVHTKKDGRRDLRGDAARFWRTKIEHLDMATVREGEDAIHHLFMVASGMDSKILGEDQILTQVKEALELARTWGTTDTLLQVLFQEAIATGKDVKTNVVFPKENLSAIYPAIAGIKKQRSFSGKTCLVIGNGQMGRICAGAFLKEGMNVYMTVRQYAHGKVSLPKGCKPIDYKERKEYIKRADIVVSATTSPHYTLTGNLLEDVDCKNIIFLDMALPRDIDPKIGKALGGTIYNVDDFSKGESSLTMEAKLRAQEIIEKHRKEFHRWGKKREWMPKMEKISEKLMKDIHLRMTKPWKASSLEEVEKQHLQLCMEDAVKKSVYKLLFEYKKTISEKDFERCIEEMQRCAQDEEE